MNIKQLIDYIIKPILRELGMYSDEAVELLVGTCCQESHGGKYIKQLGKGPACGIFQIEPNTAQDIIDNYLAYRKPLKDKVFKFYNHEMTLEENLIGNLYFQAAMCRVHYWRCKGSIPKTLQGQAEYWKTNYNTHLGKGTVDEYVENYNRLY